MICFALVCDQGHGFDAWFASGDAYEVQATARAVFCPDCGSHAVKAPMAPAVKKGRLDASRDPDPRLGERKKTYAFLKGLRAHLAANAENVGPTFPEEARKMHYGEVETRSIYGEASLAEARSLHEEGIPTVPLPLLPEDHN
jgi:hypothetical protein